MMLKVFPLVVAAYLFYVVLVIYSFIEHPLLYIPGSVLGAWVTSISRTKCIALTLMSRKSVSEDLGFRSVLLPILCIGNKGLMQFPLV